MSVKLKTCCVRAEGLSGGTVQYSTGHLRQHCHPGAVGQRGPRGQGLGGQGAQRVLQLAPARRQEDRVRGGHPGLHRPQGAGAQGERISVRV